MRQMGTINQHTFSVWEFLVNIWKNEEYSYPMAQGFVPNLMCYLHEDKNFHPCMVVVPGGGYAVAAPSEAELVAKKFYDYGCNVFVLSYTTNLFMMEPLKD